MQRIYLIRHAQTDFNLQGIVQGRKVNSDINATGKAQAQAFFEKYQGVAFPTVFTSSLKRTRQTIAPFLQTGATLVTLSGLDEISWGIEEGRKPDFPARQAFAEMVKNWKEGKLHERVREGESPLEVQMRVRQAWEQVLKATADDVLVCVHGRLLRILLCTILGEPLSKMDQFAHQNTCLYLLEYDQGTVKLLKKADTGHLRGLKGGKPRF